MGAGFALTASGCEGVVSGEILSHRERLDDLVEHFNSKKLTTEIFGKIKSLEQDDIAIRALRDFIRDTNESLDLDDSFILKPSQIARVKMRIDQHERQVGKKFGYLQSLVKIPRAILEKSPITKGFYKELDLVKNFERNQMVNQSDKSRTISKSMRLAFIEEGVETGFIGIKTFNEIMKRENNQRTANDPQERMKHAAEVDEIIKSQEGRLIRDFINLMNVNNVGFQKKIKEGIADLPGERLEAEAGRVGKAYNGNLVRAVETARSLLSDLGRVNVNALRKLRDAFWIQSTGKPYNKNKEAEVYTPYLKSFNKSIRGAIKRMEVSIKEGGYFPSVAVSEVMELKSRANKILSEENNLRIGDLIHSLARDMDTMVKLDPPANVKARNTLVERDFSKNPFFILETYGAQAIQFNKLNTIATEYQKVLKIMAKPEITAEWVKGLGDYVHDEYTLATKGLANRPAWLNKTVRTLKVAETLKAMGFGIPGAVRNIGGAHFFLVNMGRSRIKNSLGLYNSGVYSNTSIKELVNAIEKEQGFGFGEIGTELVTQGLLTKEGEEKLDFRFNPSTGQIESKDTSSNTWKLFEKTQNWGVNRALVFHRIGENFTRKWMFRMGLVDALEVFRGQSDYWAKHGGQKLNAGNWKSNHLARQAANAALWSVNKFAGEYALHAKSRILTGVPGKVNVNGELINKIEVGATSLTSLGTGLLHYPMFILDMQYKQIEGALHGLGAGMWYGHTQWDSPEMKYLAKYAAFFGFLQVLSVGLNTDLNRVIENDPLNRLADVKREIAGPDPEDMNDDGTLKEGARGHYGILSEFTGPLPDDLAFVLMQTGVAKMPDDEIGRILFGYDHLLESEEGEAKDRAYWNRMGTFFGFMANKTIPAIRDGRGWDILRHSFSAWPSTYTKGGRTFVNKYIPGTFKEAKSRAITRSSLARKKTRLAGRSPIDELERLFARKEALGGL